MDNIEKFIDHVKAECRANNIKLLLKDVKYLCPTRKIKCSGYFDEENRVLAVAKKSTAWLEILVHEFAHLTQWRENCKEWRMSSNSFGKLNDWLEGIEVRSIRQVISRVRDLELDNEKRSVKLIRKWELPIDIREYTQKANAYVAFYNWMYHTRRWCSVKNSPIKNPAVYKHMPTTFRVNHKVLSKKHRRLFEQAGI